MIGRPPISPPLPNPTLSRSAGGRARRRGGPPLADDQQRRGFRRDARGPSPCPCRRRRRSEEHTSELQSRQYLVCRLLLEKKKTPNTTSIFASTITTPHVHHT